MLLNAFPPPAIPLRYILQEALTFVLFLLLKLLLTGCIFTTLETDNTGMSLQSLFELGSMTSAGTSIQTLKKSILRSQAEKVSWCLSALKCNSVLDSNEAFQA